MLPHSCGGFKFSLVGVDHGDALAEVSGIAVPATHDVVYLSVQRVNGVRVRGTSERHPGSRVGQERH
jgi:hypothetical protein